MAGVPANFDADNAPNAEQVEANFAVTCIKHCEAYQKLITNIKPSTLRLTPHDNDLYESFKAAFPWYFEDTSRLKFIDEEAVKSAKAKPEWRAWIKEWETKIEDFSYGTLLRRDVKEEYTEANSMFVVRIQFYAFEIARNKLGLNDEFHEKEKAKAKST